MTPFSLSDIPKLKALVVEDSEDDYILLVDHLESYGVSVFSRRVDTESELLSAIRQHWDVVFSDFSMPQMNGLRALEIVRSIDKDIPFIYVSGTIGEAAAVNAIKAGAQNYVMKTDFARLIPTLERELEDAHRRREQRTNEERLRKLSLAITQSTDSVFITDANGQIEYANPAFEQLSGYKQAEILGKTPSFLRSRHHNQETYNSLWKSILEGNPFSGTLINRRKDGTEFHEEKVITPLYDEDGNISHFVSTGRDITARIESEKARERMHNVLDSTSDIVMIVEEDGTILYINKACIEALDIDGNQNLSALTLWQILSPDICERLRSRIFPISKKQRHWSGEISLQPSATTASEIPVSLVVVSHINQHSSSDYFSLVARDITERKGFEAELRHQATHDALTGLHNRNYLISRLQSSIENARAQNKEIALFLIDIDKFKRINDNLGHIAGDQLLKKVASRLENYIKHTEVVARLGSDEFVILIDDIKKQEDTISKLSTLTHIFKIPIKIEEQEVFISFSIGVSVFPKDGDNATDLLRHANVAMYRAKSLGSSQYQFYSPQMNLRGQELLKIDTELRYAIANHEFSLYYQPQIDIATGKVIGLEALLRWHSKTRGTVSPGEFIPLLESSRLIIQVGEWVVEQTCRQYNACKEAGLEDLRISANVSAVQLQDPMFQDKIKRLITLYEIPKSKLELEITENIVMQDPVRASQVMVSLNKYGVRTAIDDFGTGYSSLAYLKRFSVTTLKIDQSFIFDVTDNASDAAIVEASIILAHKLGLEVIAEGVENQQQYEFLKKLGCDVAQGFLYGRPVPGEEILSLIHQINTYQVNTINTQS
ncbi:EAL domain-containing protein [Teredinibacter sp. KSP-S5-2]|uniref:EAL domain-containing protein n=1 Tax=Teredinibacter sp. KSP-S5-2 TaxID=3034506 RepID=UPI002934BBAC|nr:EAL domain-containing protein [Teredinibacter sp. KSP-S5-2]WNO09939.1 EAL domain-containing protein [Teredinibacter sp. KSP-S5-2]